MATVLTTQGKGIVTARLRGSGTEPVNAGWGTGAGTAAVGDTDLFTAATEARTVGTSSQQTTSVANDTYRVVALITANATKTITNAMLFDAVGTGSPPTGGNGFVKGDFGGIAVNNGDSIQFTFNLQFT